MGDKNSRAWPFAEEKKKEGKKTERPSFGHVDYIYNFHGFSSVWLAVWLAVTAGVELNRPGVYVCVCFFFCY